MTEEAFIRAVLDRPGQDTPRLVYADWLDDHGHPARAAYLRAEREAATTGDTSVMRELAGGLDPVWVARVTLPPLGVCVEQAGVAGAGPPVSAADVDAAEGRLGVTFPADYRAFLLNYNGGVLRRLWGYVDGEPIDDGLPVTLYPLSGPDADSPGVEEETWAARGRLDAPAGEWEWLDPATVAAHLGLARIGWSEGRALLLGVRGVCVGIVYHPDVLGTDFPNPTALARSIRGLTFSEFLARHNGLLPFWPPRSGEPATGPAP